MANYYVLDASRNVKEYISIIDGTKELETACQMSEFQFLTTKAVTIEVDEDSGRIFQDFIYDNGVPVMSDRMKEYMDKLEVDYLFYKKLILTKKELGIEEIYWLALPQRIKCLNKEESEIDEILNIADEIVINQQRVGRFKIFKLADVGNWEIILSEDMAQALKTQDFRGVHIYEINS